MNEHADALETALRNLHPAAELDRDRTLFLAGKAAAESARPRAGWMWPCATAASTLLAVGLAVALWMQAATAPRAMTARQSVRQPDHAAASGQFEPRAAPGGDDYLRMRNLLLREGVTALPAPAAENPRLVRPTWTNRPAELQELLDG